MAVAFEAIVLPVMTNVSTSPQVSMAPPLDVMVLLSINREDDAPKITAGFPVLNSIALSMTSALIVFMPHAQP